MTYEILIVDDDRLQRELLTTLIKRSLDFAILTAENGREALDILSNRSKDRIKLVILDLTMPVMDGRETLSILKQTHPQLPVIMLTGTSDVETAISTLKLGATDFVTKPFQPDRMVITIQNAIKMNVLQKEVDRLQNVEKSTFSFNDLIGNSTALNDSIYLGRKASGTDIPSLITGPTGSGKEVFARAIHGESHRTGKPFIAVNCGAIPAQLVESTLFGHEKGAFTGATDKKPGKFREANGGTIFLDEVGELPPEAQVKLLRVLQQKEVETVGAARPMPIDVRILSATNRDLEKEVSEGRFREDLFFRLNVLHLDLPPLSARRDDILPLAHHFIERGCSNEGKMILPLSKQAQNLLQNHDWNGNVRQLENSINRALVMCNSDIIDACDFQLTEALQEADNTAQGTSNHSSDNTPYIDNQGSIKSMELIEKEALTSALEHYQYNITQAADALGIAKSTFYRKIKHHGIDVREL